jgi:hypothetical protein
MQQLLETLAGVHPLLPWSILTLAIWVSVFAIRKWTPLLWTVPTLVWARDWAIARWPESDDAILDLWKVVQALPAILTGALVGAWQMGSDPSAAWKGAAAGALAPAIHYLMRALPFLPYLGKLGKARPPRLLLLVLAASGVSCAALRAQDVRDARHVIAEILCARENAPRLGLSVEDVRRGYCAADAVIAPFLDRVEKNPDEAVGLATTPPVGACAEQ